MTNRFIDKVSEQISDKHSRKLIDKVSELIGKEQIK